MLERAPEFEDAYARFPAVEIRLQRFEQTRQQRGAHHVELAGDRIEHPQGPGIGIDRGFRCGRHEAERDDLLPVEIGQRVPERRAGTRRLRRRQHVLDVRGRRGRYRVVAVHARGLLDEVLLDREIEAKRRRRHHEVVAFAHEGEAQARERGGDRSADIATPRIFATRAGRTRTGSRRGSSSRRRCR